MEEFYDLYNLPNISESDFTQIQLVRIFSQLSNFEGTNVREANELSDID